MMNKLFILIFLFLVANTSYAQNKHVDSMVVQIGQHLDNLDDEKAVIIKGLSVPHTYFELIKKEKQNLADAEAEGNVAKQLNVLQIFCGVYLSTHALPGLLSTSLTGIRISQNKSDAFHLSRFLQTAGLAYSLSNDVHQADRYYFQAISVATKAKDTTEVINVLSNMESDYSFLKKADSALYYGKRELMLITQDKKPDKWGLERVVMGDMGEALAAAGEPDSALKYCHRYLTIGKAHGQPNEPYTLNIMAVTFLKKNQPDSAFQYALESYNISSKTKRWDFTADACALLAKIYEGSDDKKSLYYLKALMAADDSIHATENSRQFQLIADRDQQYDQELRDAQEKFNTRVRLYIVIGTACVLAIIGIILWRNYRRQKQNNILLNEQKEEILAQRDSLGSTLEKLKTTQTQLIQSEKMASLGELTAGIAHEIQNPLNFVNNFSEVSIELLDELKEEAQAGHTDDVIAIATDLTQNLEKINHHGKRADFIVKGMLQHSRTSTGEKQPTNINVLADEFLKLSYHGLRAKDKNFNAELVTNFDESLPKVNIAQQDIGRVLLNLFNNAFYAVNQKQKTAGRDYKPEVTVSTAIEKNKLVINVKDNGNGIPDAIKDKIMQPFFTTKPTGEGTGLGLSLSYDIVVKGHGGSINLHSEEGKFTEFTVTIPII